MLDIVDVKEAVKKGEMKAYVKDGVIYLRNSIGEAVIIGKVDDAEMFAYKYEFYDYSGNPYIEVLDVTESEDKG